MKCARDARERRPRDGGEDALAVDFTGGDGVTSVFLGGLLFGGPILGRSCRVRPVRGATANNAPVVVFRVSARRNVLRGKYPWVGGLCGSIAVESRFPKPENVFYGLKINVSPVIERVEPSGLLPETIFSVLSPRSTRGTTSARVARARTPAPARVHARSSRARARDRSIDRSIDRQTRAIGRRLDDGPRGELRGERRRLLHVLPRGEATRRRRDEVQVLPPRRRRRRRDARGGVRGLARSGRRRRRRRRRRTDVP